DPHCHVSDIRTAESCPGSLQTNFVDIGERDVHALGGESDRHGAAEAARGARYGGHFSFQLLHPCASRQCAASCQSVSRKGSRKNPKWPMRLAWTSRGATARTSDPADG